MNNQLVFPRVYGSAAVINKSGEILLIRRTDNHLWTMPGGKLEVGETPAEGIIRETLEETGVLCKPIALVGIYDSRLLDKANKNHSYKITFLYEPIEGLPASAFDNNETLEIGWFAENKLPQDLSKSHYKRINHAYKVRNGDRTAYFDQINL